MRWEDKPQVKKGNIGEKIVKIYLKKLFPKSTIYKPETTGPHPIDKIWLIDDKEFYVESKSKTVRNLHPDTGFNVSNYETYKKISSDCIIFFVDELLKKIYGGLLSYLEKPIKLKYKSGRRTIRKKYPSKEINRFGVSEIYFPLMNMKDFTDIDDSTVSELKNLNTRSYSYNIKWSNVEIVYDLDELLEEGDMMLL